VWVGGKYIVCAGGADTEGKKKISAKPIKRAQAKNKRQTNNKGACQKYQGKKRKKRDTQRGCLKGAEINSI